MASWWKLAEAFTITTCTRYWGAFFNVKIIQSNLNVLTFLTALFVYLQTVRLFTSGVWLDFVAYPICRWWEISKVGMRSALYLLRSAGACCGSGSIYGSAYMGQLASNYYHDDVGLRLWILSFRKRWQFDQNIWIAIVEFSGLIEDLRYSRPDLTLNHSMILIEENYLVPDAFHDDGKMEIGINLVTSNFQEFCVSHSLSYVSSCSLKKHFSLSTGDNFPASCAKVHTESSWAAYRCRLRIGIHATRSLT